VGNQDLERLEALLDRFNFLEAAGIVRQELRHSAFHGRYTAAKRNRGSVEEAGQETAGLGRGGLDQTRDDNRSGQQRHRAVAEEP
jgi:hypothetical protein